MDTNGDGNVDYDAFLSAMRGSMNGTRAGLVQKAFCRFDKEGSNSIKASDLKVVMDVSTHPHVVSGLAT